MKSTGRRYNKNLLFVDWLEMNGPEKKMLLIIIWVLDFSVSSYRWASFGNHPKLSRTNKRKVERRKEEERSSIVIQI